MDENTYSMHYAFRKEALLWDGFYVVFHLKNKVQNGGGVSTDVYEFWFCNSFGTAVRSAGLWNVYFETGFKMYWGKKARVNTSNRIH